MQQEPPLSLQGGLSRDHDEAFELAHVNLFEASSPWECQGSSLRFEIKERAAASIHGKRHRRMLMRNHPAAIAFHKTKGLTKP